MATRECGKHQVASIGLPGMNLYLRAGLANRANFVHVAEIQQRIYTLTVQVHGHGNDVHIASALAIAQQGAFNTIGTGHYRELGSRNGTSAIIMSVQTHHHGVSPVDMSAEKFNLIRKDIGCGHFHSSREIDDAFLLCRWLPDIDYRITHVHGIINFSAGKTLRGVLENPIGLRVLLSESFYVSGAGNRNINNPLLAGFKNLLPLHNRG